MEEGIGMEKVENWAKKYGRLYSPSKMTAGAAMNANTNTNKVNIRQCATCWRFITHVWSRVTAYHHVHCSGRHDWFQTFDIAHSLVELLRVSL